MNTRLIAFNWMMNKTAIRWLSLSSLLMLNIASADELKDPTTPPPSLYSQAPEGEAGPLFNGPVLQSIILGSNYHAAIINGQKIMLGQKFEGATLIKLNEREAVLRNPDNSLKTLTMDFAIQKKIIHQKK